MLWSINLYVAEPGDHTLPPYPFSCVQSPSTPTLYKFELTLSTYVLVSAISMFRLLTVMYFYVQLIRHYPLPLSCTGSFIFFKPLFLKTLNFASSESVRDEASHPYSITVTFSIIIFL